MKFEETVIELRKGKEISGFFAEICGINKISLKEVNNRIKFTEFPMTLSWSELVNILFYGEWSVKEEQGKTFDQVFESFKEGKKIRRKSWSKFSSISNTPCYLPDVRDLLANDWEVIE